MIPNTDAETTSEHSRQSSRLLATTLQGKQLPATQEAAAEECGWSLVVITGTALGQRVEVEKSVVVGRSPECGWVLQGGGLSRRHCTIWTVGDRLWIRDLASTNGIHVNGRRVLSQALEAGDEVALGDVVLRVLRRKSVEDSYHAAMTELAYVDELTGLGNRRRFQDLLEAGVSQASLHADTFSLVLIDLDDFKNINDRYGHDVGDDVLKSCAEQLRSVTRCARGLARIGGEEFAAILHGADIAEAATYAERCRKTVYAKVFSVPGQAFRVSASLGVASWRGDMTGVAALVRIADERLYAAKRAGKNCVVAE